MDRSGCDGCDAGGVSLLRCRSHRANGYATANGKADGPGQSVRTHATRTTNRLQPQKAFDVRSGMQEMPHESGAGEADDLPGYKYLHGMPRDHREAQALDSEARRICQLQAGGSLGSCLYRLAGRSVESPRTYRSRSKMRDVPRAGSRDGGDVGSHERHDNV